MEQLVRSFIEKHRLLHRGARVLIGVSGGPDSMALLHFLKQVKEEWDLDLIVLSVDHQLRGEDSEADFLYVKDICENWDLPFHGTSLDVRGFSEKEQLSIEVGARKLRYRFFEKKMKELEGDYLALGHHGDDQVETLVMKLVRTASSSAFHGIPVKRPFADGKIIRPFLAVTKQDIENYCEKNGIVPRIDATNLETFHTRNYYRHHVVPLLKEKNNNIHQTAQHLSETLEEDETFLQKEAAQVMEHTATSDEENKRVILDINRFNMYARPLQRRAYHLILNYLYETLPSQMSYVHEEQFFRLIGEASGNKRLDYPQGLKLERAYDKLLFHFHPEHPHQGAFHKTLSIPGTIRLPDGSSLTVTYSSVREKETPFSLYISPSEVALPLHVRTRRDGDRMTWKGLAGTKKLKDIFIDEKIPLNKRDTWPIVTDDDGNILWLVGLKKGMRPEADDARYIYIQYEQGDQ